MNQIITTTTITIKKEKKVRPAVTPTVIDEAILRYVIRKQSALNLPIYRDAIKKYNEENRILSQDELPFRSYKHLYLPFKSMRAEIILVG